MATDRASVFSKLLRGLPAAGEGGDPEQEIRAVLRPLLERVAACGSAADSVAVDPSTCPNCGEDESSERSPYCSAHCRDMAAFVRQLRASIENRTILQEERQIGAGQALWSLQGGGYPYRQSLVPAKTVARVIERERGSCSVCGAPATEVDHTGSG